ncbi:glucan biosynthesis protein G [Chromohalobacter sp. HP20-39]|uniref:glucan biosynthesis protein G n=1 Tax=Chromohalobacter sp. HP20-39 TaxID=3079306 RepID=UPI00294AB0F8|nr:glucan biosynthesis protein G [Chromohalobacter sp. HP20-39]MDV6320356.1 glucan biosynthesis protein G [Chromohalobacter sp. HP20-39]
MSVPNRHFLTTSVSCRFRWPLVGMLSIWMILVAQTCFAFGFEDVAKKAEKLAGQGYQAPEASLPESLRTLEYADYAQIQTKDESMLWQGENLPFKLAFFHEGMHFDSAVTLHTVVNGEVQDLSFDPNDFDYGNLDIPKEDLKGLGFSGFKVLNAINSENQMDEVMAFQGASYFRALGRHQVYGSSGRALAIDTALPSGEEFPSFREFWIVKPKPDSQYLTIFALLDSPSLTGAYRYVLRPGEDTVVDVTSRLFMRNAVEKLGVAPLTSMYLYGPAQPTETLNYRPAIHDSNGLLVHDGGDGTDANKGGWIWRPLANPKNLMIEEQEVASLKGFGLLQRSHNFHDYEDLVDRYDRRPSVWIEPQGDWGKGTVELIQIPTPDETNDNIVAMWKPTGTPKAGDSLQFNYRMYWTTHEAKFYAPNLSWVDQTRRSRGEVRKDNLVREPDGSLAFVIDVKGPGLEALEDGANVAVDATVGDKGELVASRAVPNKAAGGWRIFLRVKRGNASQPTDIRVFLKDGEKRLSETWHYRLPANG